MCVCGVSGGRSFPRTSNARSAVKRDFGDRRKGPLAPQGSSRTGLGRLGRLRLAQYGAETAGELLGGFALGVPAAERASSTWVAKKSLRSQLSSNHIR